MKINKNSTKKTEVGSQEEEDGLKKAKINLCTLLSLSALQSLFKQTPSLLLPPAVLPC